MRNALVASVLLVSAVTAAFGDLGHSSVYAVCRLTMRDGKAMEGVLRIAAGGYEKQLHANGFYYELNGQPYTVNLFSPAFRSIDFVSGETIYDPEPSDRGTGFPTDRGTLYYLRTVPTEHYFQNANQDVLKKAQGTPGTIVLNRTIIHRGLYVLSDYLPVYMTVATDNSDVDADMLQALPPTKRPRLDGQLPSPTNVPLVQIARLELLTKPPAKWLSAISANKKRLKSEYEKSGLEDWLFPVWFHEIQPGSELDSEYKNFKQWNY